jgi:hypothetical protein
LHLLINELEKLFWAFDHKVGTGQEQGFLYGIVHASAFDKTNSEDLQCFFGSSGSQHVIDHIAHISASRIGNADLLGDPQERVGVGFGIFYLPSGSTKYSVLFLMTFVEGDHAVKVGGKAKPLQGQFRFKPRTTTGNS